MLALENAELLTEQQDSVDFVALGASVGGEQVEQ